MNVIVKHLPLALLTAFCGKILFTGPDLASMGIIFALSALSLGFIKFSNEQKIEELRELVNKESNVIKSLAQALDDLRTKQASFQIAQGMRKVGS